MKKKRIIKIIGIILIIILIFIAIHTIRNTIIISDLQNKIDNYSNSTNFVSSPDQINSSAENSLISALWFFKENVLDKININSSTPVYKVSRIVNGGKNGLPEREKIFKTLQSYIDCN